MNTLSGPSADPAAGGPPRQLVVLLHGVGADGADLITLSQAMAPMLPHARFIAPNGPEACDMAPMGYQWFSLSDRDPARMLSGVERSAPLIDGFINAELARDGLGDHQLALLGFSQGTMMSLHVAPRRAIAMAGVLGFSGALLAPDKLLAEVVSKPPMLLIHGDADQVVPVQALLGAIAGLKAAGIEAQGSVRPGLPHGIDPEGIAAGVAFLAEAFKETGMESGA